MAGVGVVGTAAGLAARAARACHRRGVPVAVTGASSDEVGVAALLDACARRTDIAAVLIHGTIDGDHAEVAAACRAIAPHLPILFVSAASPQDDPYFEPWLASVGAVWTRSLTEAADALAIVRSIEPPADARALVLGAEPATAEATAAQARAAGLFVRVDPDAELERALADFENDLVIAVLPEPPDPLAAAGALAAQRRANPELSLVIAADGDDAWTRVLRETLEPLGCTVVDGDLDVAVGLRALASWQRAVAVAGTPPPRPRDPARLRRALAAARRPDAAVFAPEIQSDLVGALGLPFARARRAGYLEDALIAAAELGYPLRMTAIHPAQRWPEVPVWIAVRRSDDLLSDGEALLASVRAEVGQRAELVVADSPEVRHEVECVARRHERYGVVVDVRIDGAPASAVVPLDPRALAATLVRGGRTEPAFEAIVAGCNAAVAALSSADELGAFAVSLDVASAGFVTRHVAAELAGSRP